MICITWILLGFKVQKKSNDGLANQQLNCLNQFKWISWSSEWTESLKWFRFPNTTGKVVGLCAKSNIILLYKQLLVGKTNYWRCHKPSSFAAEWFSIATFSYPSGWNGEQTKLEKTKIAKQRIWRLNNTNSAWEKVMICKKKKKVKLLIQITRDPRRLD